MPSENIYINDVISSFSATMINGANGEDDDKIKIKQKTSTERRTPFIIQLYRFLFSSFRFSSLRIYDSVINFNWCGIERYIVKINVIYYLQKFCKLLSAMWVTLKSGCVSSSSNKTIRTTTILIRLPIAGSLYSDDTIFMMVNKYVSM